LPAGQPVYALGVDETLAAEIPFYSGRALVPLVPAMRPPWVLVQDHHDGRETSPGPQYRLQASRDFGSGRSLLLWRRQEPAAQP
jgi:hypothetical protein